MFINNYDVMEYLMLYDTVNNTLEKYFVREVLGKDSILVQDERGKVKKLKVSGFEFDSIVDLYIDDYGAIQKKSDSVFHNRIVYFEALDTAFFFSESRKKLFLYREGCCASIDFVLDIELVSISVKLSGIIISCKMIYESWEFLHISSEGFKLNEELLALHEGYDINSFTRAVI